MLGGLNEWKTRQTWAHEKQGESCAHKMRPTPLIEKGVGLWHVKRDVFRALKMRRDLLRKPRLTLCTQNEVDSVHIKWRAHGRTNRAKLRRARQMVNAPCKRGGLAHQKRGQTGTRKMTQAQHTKNMVGSEHAKQGEPGRIQNEAGLVDRSTIVARTKYWCHGSFVDRYHRGRF